MAWTQTLRDRIAAAASRRTPPPFTETDDLGVSPAPVVVVEQPGRSEDLLPRGVRTAGAWAWRFILFVVAAYLALRVVALLRVVVIPVVVAMLLAALFQPVAAALTRRGMKRSLAAGLVLIVALLLVFGGLGLIVRTFISQIDSLSAQVSDGIDEVQKWLAQGPLHVSDAQLGQYVDRARQAITENQGALTSG